jgi:tagatose 6-phosphate kinase
MIICLGTTPAFQRTLAFTRFTLDTVNRAIEVRETASGKSINVARVLHTLGEEVVALGFAGGQVADFLRKELDLAGVRHDFVTAAATTRTCTTLLDQAGHTVTELVEESHPVEAEAWNGLRNKLDRALKGAGALVLSGSLAPGCGPDFYRDCIERAAREGVPVVLDAAREPLRLGLEAGPYIAKPNRLELQEITHVSIGSDAALCSALAGLVKAGARWGVVTLGPPGIAVSDGSRFWRVSSPAIKAVNPIGSGDAVAAGLAAGIVRGTPFPEAARLAAACGAANAMTATSGNVVLSDVERLLPQTSVTEIEK